MRLTCIAIFVFSLVTLGSANLGTDLRDFKQILPTFRLPIIIGKHYLFDSSFRDGYSYLKSNSFKELLQQELEKSPEIRRIVDFLGLKLNLAAIQNNLRSEQIPLELDSDDVSADARSFSSFIDEVVDALPNDKFRNLIKMKIEKSPEFAQLYAKVMDPRFKQMVYQARNSAGLQKAVRTLANHEINVDHLLSVVFHLLDTWKQ